MIPTTGTDGRRAHGVRFRKIGGDRYPRQVAEAYDRDLDRAMADSDEQVAATVADWERRHGLPVRDRAAIGAERDDEAIEVEED